MATATYEPIATTTLGSAAASITFSSIAATWTDLRLVFVGTFSSADYLRMRFNSDTGTNYSATYMLGDGSSATSGRFTSTSSIYMTISNVPSSTIPVFVTSDIEGYAGSTYKTALNTVSLDLNGSGDVIRNVSLWRSTSAITAISLYLNGGNNLAAGSTATLYGIKAA